MMILNLCKLKKEYKNYVCANVILDLMCNQNNTCIKKSEIERFLFVHLQTGRK